MFLLATACPIHSDSNHPFCRRGRRFRSPQTRRSISLRLPFRLARIKGRPKMPETGSLKRTGWFTRISSAAISSAVLQLEGCPIALPMGIKPWLLRDLRVFRLFRRPDCRSHPGKLGVFPRFPHPDGRSCGLQRRKCFTPVTLPVMVSSRPKIDCNPQRCNQFRYGIQFQNAKPPAEGQITLIRSCESLMPDARWRGPEQ